MEITMRIKEVITHKVTVDVDETTYKQLKANDALSDEIAGDYTNGRSTMTDGYFELDDIEVCNENKS